MKDEIYVKPKQSRRTFSGKDEAEARASLEAWCAKHGREVPPVTVTVKTWCVEVSFVEVK